MKLEDIVVSVELAKELKENGYPQGTLFHWELLGNGQYYIQPEVFVGAFSEEQWAAPTASEIGEQLPKETYLHSWVNGKYRLMPWASLADLNDHRFDQLKNNSFESDTEVDSRAKLWLYLKKNNLLGGTQ